MEIASPTILTTSSGRPVAPSSASRGFGNVCTDRFAMRKVNGSWPKKSFQPRRFRNYAILLIRGPTQVRARSESWLHGGCVSLRCDQQGLSLEMCRTQIGWFDDEASMFSISMQPPPVSTITQLRRLAHHGAH